MTHGFVIVQRMSSAVYCGPEHRGLALQEQIPTD